jgi:hypothetical protein
MVGDCAWPELDFDGAMAASELRAVKERKMPAAGIGPDFSPITPADARELLVVAMRNCVSWRAPFWLVDRIVASSWCAVRQHGAG